MVGPEQKNREQTIFTGKLNIHSLILNKYSKRNRAYFSVLDKIIRVHANMFYRYSPNNVRNIETSCEYRKYERLL